MLGLDQRVLFLYIFTSLVWIGGVGWGGGWGWASQAEKGVGVSSDERP